MNQNYLKTLIIALSSLAALYALLTLVWDLPNPVLVLGALSALAALSGLLMGIRANNERNYDGTLSTTGHDPDTGIPYLALEISIDPRMIASKDSILLKSIDETGSHSKQSL